MPYIISASGMSIDAIGETEDEAWAGLSEAIGLSEDGLRASDSLEAVPATERLVEHVREHGGHPKDTSWSVRDGTADLEDPGPTMERHNISIDRPRWTDLEAEAKRLGVSVSAVIRMAVDEYME